MNKEYYVFTPNKGVNDINLGASLKDIEMLMGLPKRSKALSRERVRSFYDDLSLTYDEKGFLVGIEIYSTVPLFFKGEDIFLKEVVRNELIAMDGEAKEIMETIVLLRVGLAIPKELNESSIYIFASGEWDHLLNDMRPYKK